MERHLFTAESVLRVLVEVDPDVVDVAIWLFLLRTGSLSSGVGIGDIFSLFRSLGTQGLLGVSKFLGRRLVEEQIQGIPRRVYDKSACSAVLTTFYGKRIVL